MDTWTHGHPKKTGRARVWEDKKRLKIFGALFFLAILNVSGEHLEAWIPGYLDTQKNSVGRGRKPQKVIKNKKEIIKKNCFKKT